jgi:hypothetical protein
LWIAKVFGPGLQPNQRRFRSTPHSPNQRDRPRQSSRVYERQGDAMRYLNAEGQIAWKAGRAIALFKLRPDHTADEQVEAVAELTQSALDTLILEWPTLTW